MLACGPETTRNVFFILSSRKVTSIYLSHQFPSENIRCNSNMRKNQAIYKWYFQADLYDIQYNESKVLAVLKAIFCMLYYKS